MQKTKKPRSRRDAIRALIALLKDPKRWTKRAYARNDRGNSCHPSDLAAACFCITGGLYRVTGSSFNQQTPLFARTLRFLDHTIQTKTKYDHSGVTGLNDSLKTTHADVMGLLRSAARALA
jgi:hypothetical protein